MKDNNGNSVEKKEMVNHPRHYAGANGMEVIDVIENFHLGFALGNAVKYILRAGKKDDYLQELLKAEWYVKREIENCKKMREKARKAGI